MKTPELYKANQLKHWQSDRKVEFNGRELWIPARPYQLKGVNIIQRLMYSFGVFTGKYDALDWQENLNEE